MLTKTIGNPPEYTDEEEAIAEWLAACPVDLSSWDRSRIDRIVDDARREE